MLREVMFEEDLLRMAAESFELSRHCPPECKNFHALWPYRRITRVTGAVEAGGPVLEKLLAELLRARPRVLLAGAADTGSLALTARAGRDAGIHVTVVDRCDTPLELCRRFARRWSMSVDTVHADLAHLDMPSRFDLALAHSILQFIAPEARIDMLQRLARSLDSDGRLVIVYNTGGRIAGELAREYRPHYADWVIERLDAMNVPLPEPRDAFRSRLEQYARTRETREGEFADPETVEALLEAGGFEIESRISLDMSLAAQYQRFVSRLEKRRHVTIARVRSRP